MIIYGFDLPNWVLLLFSFPIIKWYLTKDLQYWKRLGINGPTPLPFIGNFLKSVFTPLDKNELENYNKFKPLYGLYAGTKPVLCVADPKLLKDILIRDFNIFRNRPGHKVNNPITQKSVFHNRDDDWKRLRMIVSPTFTTGKLKKMSPMITDCVQHCVDHFQTYVDSKKHVDVRNAFGRLTMDVIAKCAFATETNSYKNPDNKFLSKARLILDINMWKLLLIQLLPKFILPLLGLRSHRNDEGNRFFIEVARNMLRQRKKNSSIGKRVDLLQLLIDAEDKGEQEKDGQEDLANFVNQDEEEARRRELNLNLTRKTLDEDEIVAQTWVFFLAGYETTASTLGFCAYELAINPEVQEKLFQEVESSIDCPIDELDYEKVWSLNYLDAVVSETLRKYPPLVILERVASKDYQLGETGITINKGQAVTIPIYAMHHDPKFFPDPESFDPDRFLPANRHKLVPYTYLPFGGGPRNCVGMRFALLEIKLCLAALIKRFRLVRTTRTQVPLQFDPSYKLFRIKEILIGVEPRSG